RAERNQPEPVADAHQMDGALPAESRRHPGLPRWIVGPVVDLDARAEPPPRGVRAVRARADEAELPFQKTDTAAGVDHPARGDGARPARAGQRNAMRAVRLERDRSDTAIVQDLRAALGVGAQEEILQPPAIELERRDRRKHGRPELHALRDVPIVAVWKEVPEPELL